MTDQRAEPSPENLGREIQAARRRVSDLQSRASDLPPSEQYKLLARSFEEIQRTLEELASTAETVRTQNRELDDTRQFAELERHRYKELFEFAPVAYLVTDIDGTIREANIAAGRIFNSSPSLLIGQAVTRFCRDRDDAELGTSLLGLRDVEEGEEWKAVLHPRNGEPFTGGLTVSVVRDLAGSPVALRWVIRDMRRSEGKRS